MAYSTPHPPSFDYFDEPRLHREQLIKTHLIELDYFPLRTLIKLENAGIKTIRDLLEWRDGPISNIGRLVKANIKSLLDWLEIK